ncbi:MAG: RNA polymerase subunit sigma-24, partial [Streptosporangiaceae bacterium]
DGPAAGLEIVAGLEASGDLAGYYLLPAIRADLLRRLGDRPGAAAAYRQALDLAATEPERRYLAGRLAEAEDTRGR